MLGEVPDDSEEVASIDTVRQGAGPQLGAEDREAEGDERVVEMVVKEAVESRRALTGRPAGDLLPLGSHCSG